MTYWLYVLLCSFLLGALMACFLRGASKNYFWWGYSPLLYAVVWTGVSLVVIEYGFYITEQGAYSHFSGAAFFYIVYSSIFGFGIIAGNVLSGNTAPRLVKPTGMFIAGALLCIVITVQSLLLVNAVTSPKSWFNLGIDRWNFWENSRFPSLKMVTGDTAYPYFYLSSALYYYYKKSGKRSLAYLTIAGALMHVTFLFLQGQKYSGFIVCAFAYFIPYLMMFKIRMDISLFKNVKLLAAIGVVIMLLVLVVVVWFSNTWTSSKMAMSPLQNAAYRVFVLQGHVFWGVDHLMSTKDITMSESWNLFWDVDGSGVSTLMQLVGDPQLVANYQERGVRYATVHPSLAVVLFGPIGVVILQFALGVFVCWVVRCLVCGVESCNVLITFGALNTLICLYGVFMMSELALFLSPKFVVPLGIMVVSLLNVRGYLPKE